MAESGIVQALGRGLDIVRLVAAAPGGIRLRELADQMGLKKTTVHNLAKTLVVNDFLVQDEESRYRLGAAIQELFISQQSNAQLDRVKAFLKQALIAFPDCHFVYSEPLNSELFGRLTYDEKTHPVMQQPWNYILPPYSTAAGLVAFAYLNPEEQASLKRRHPFNTEGINVWKSQEAFETEVQRTRDEGCAVFPFDKDMFRIAGPVLNSFGNLEGMLTMTFRKEAVAKATDQNKAITYLKQNLKELNNAK